MRINNPSREIEINEENLETSWEWNNSQNLVSHRSYHEMADRPLSERDELSQLKFQMKLLADLHGRQRFLMREIRFLLKV